MTWPKSVYLAVLLLLLGIAPVRAAAAGSPAEPGVVFLRQEDPVPVDAVLIRELRLSATSYADSCAWFELLLKGARIASGSGANVVKILDRNDHGLQGCDALRLGIYKVDSPHNADRAFRWNAGRRLRWEDFQGRPRPGAGETVAAETACGISVETSLAPASARARVYVFNTFDKRQSWVGEGQQCEAVLRHEQGHWDLCELYTRKMQARFDSQNIRGSRLNEIVGRIYDQVEAEYLQRQEAYERETRHGLDHEAQARWERLLARELANG